MAAAQAKANEIYQQLKAGAKFDELARKESNGSTAEQGGDLGYFKRNDLAKELEDQSFALKAGEFTQPIRTRQGFIILHVDDRIEAGTPPLDRIRDQIQDQIYTLKVQPALRDYLTKLREEAYIDIKPGYTDSGASPNQTKLIYASDTGPQTKQVRGKLGMGKKKTIVIVGRDKNDHPRPSAAPRNSAPPRPKSMPSRRPSHDRKAAEAAAAKAAADAAEKEKLSHMSPKERSKYLAARRNARQRRKPSCSARKRSSRKKPPRTKPRARPTRPEPPRKRPAKSPRKPRPRTPASRPTPATRIRPQRSRQDRGRAQTAP